MCTHAVAGYFRGLNTSVLRFFLRFRAAVRGRDKICGSKNHLGNLHLWHRRLPHTLPLFNAQNIDSSFWGLSVCPPTFQAHSHRCPLSLWLLLYSTGPKYIPRLLFEILRVQCCRQEYSAGQIIEVKGFVYTFWRMTCRLPLFPDRVVKVGRSGLGW